MTSSAEILEWDTPAALGLGIALGAAGLNIASSLSREQYDARVPEGWLCQSLFPTTRTVFVIGSGGPDFYFAARNARPRAEHPLDEFCEELVNRTANTLSQGGNATRTAFYWQRRGGEGAGPGQFADFVALARAAGLGAPSRLGLLLHRRYGPWFSIRALLFCANPTPEGVRPRDGFDPCRLCASPCISACHGEAVSRDPFAAARCAEARHEFAACARRCDARLACPVGATHRYGTEALAHHMTSHFRNDP